MNINKNSWHFELLDHFDHNVVWHLQRGDHVSLCNYFWNVVGALLKVLAVIGGGTVVTVVAGIVLYGFFGSLMYLLLPLTGPLFDYKLYELGFLLLLYGLIMSILLGIGGSVTGQMKVFPDYLKRNTAVCEEQPSLLASWLKAKKDKVCPLVKLGDK